MSKKASLSPGASLATCLAFAGQVLLAATSPQEVCTKSTLAPMVVAAHRCGQQVVKQRLNADTIVNLRELLKLLRVAAQGAAGCSGLENLAIADVTWDFEGLVQDTLEMELLELEERATTNDMSICVVFTTSTPTAKTQQAVIWFPSRQTQSQRDEDGHCSVKKRQYLLYMCPGRVKVVKSVPELVKKMHEELPTVNEHGAMYKVWTVLGRPRSNNQQEHQQPRSSASVGDFHQLEKSPTVLPGVDTSSQSASYVQQQSVEAIEEEVPSRLKPATSIFTFERASRACVLPVSSLESSMGRQPHGPETGTGDEAVRKQQQDEEDSGGEEEGMLDLKKERRCGSTAASQRQGASLSGQETPPPASPRTTVLSTSLGAFPGTSSHHSSAVAALPGDPPFNHTWRSLDSKFARSKPPMGPPLTERHSIVQDSNRDLELPSGDKVDVLDQSRVGLQRWMLDSHESRPSETPDRSMFTFQVAVKSNDDVSSCFKRSIDSSTSLTTCESPRKTPQSAADACTRRETREHRSNSIKSTAPSIAQLDVDAGKTPAEVISSLERAVQPSMEVISSPKSSKSPLRPAFVAVNYKEKLGARVWWELEYVARKLALEETQERQQQAKRSQTERRSTTRRNPAISRAQSGKNPAQSCRVSGQSFNTLVDGTTATPSPLAPDSAAKASANTSIDREPHRPIFTSTSISTTVAQSVSKRFDCRDVEPQDNNSAHCFTPQLTHEPEFMVAEHNTGDDCEDDDSHSDVDEDDCKPQQHAEQDIAVVPFTVRGRVPIRASSRARNLSPPSTPHNQSFETPDGAALVFSPPQPPPRAKANAKPASIFIPVGEFADSKMPTNVSTTARHEKLVELRQKKLKQLQRTRDAALVKPETGTSLSRSTLGKRPSNRQLMQNALAFTLLAGGSLAKEREAALAALANSHCDNFVVLLKSPKELQFRALYETHTEQDEAVRIFSVLSASSKAAPVTLRGDAVAQFFKYSSAKKQFLAVATRSFTVKTDACALASKFVRRPKTLAHLL